MNLVLQLHYLQFIVLAVFAGASRWGALACTGVALLGFLKLNVTGPGITSTVGQLWTKKT